MPEGDTVHRAAARIHDALAGRPLDRAELRVPRFSAVDLRGREVIAARSRGKHVFIVVGPDSTEPIPTAPNPAGQAPVILHLHLKMEGRIHVHCAGERWRFPAHTARLILRAGDVEVVGTELGLLHALTPDEADHVVEHLGPDLLGEDWDPETDIEEIVRRITARPDRTIGEALLDQRNLAGIGTIYRAELCFLRGVDPRDRVSAVPDLPGMIRLARRLLAANADRAVRVTTGDARRGRELWVYGRDGRPCRRCGDPVETFRLGDRVAFRCPSCQPSRDRLGPSPTKENL